MLQVVMYTQSEKVIPYLVRILVFRNIIFTNSAMHRHQKFIIVFVRFKIVLNFCNLKLKFCSEIQFFWYSKLYFWNSVCIAFCVLTHTMFCTLKQQKQKIPRIFLLSAFLVTIGSSKSVEKNVLQQCPIGAASKSALPMQPGLAGSAVLICLHP